MEPGLYSMEGVELKDGDTPYFIEKYKNEYRLVRPRRPDSFQRCLNYSKIFFINRSNAEKYIDSLKTIEHRDKKINLIIDVE